MKNQEDVQTLKGAEDECLDGDGLLLYDYVEDLLNENDRQRFESHFAHCRHCQQKLTRMNWFSQCLRESYSKEEREDNARAMGAH